jgi:choline-sulfatase
MRAIQRRVRALTEAPLAALNGPGLLVFNPAMNCRMGFRLLFLLTTVAWLADSSAPAAERKPNILFIITDQQFADAMSCRMGKQFINTPTMDRLAQTGTLFTRAYSSSPLCMPWRNSVFTGRYPHETRVTQNAEPPAGLDSKEFVCLGTYFRNAGYDAAYSGKWHLCFDIKDTNAHSFEIVTGKGKGNHDAGVTEGAVNFLTRPHDKPFVLVTSFLNPHNICEWARRLAGREQVLNCGEIGEPPPLDQLPPLPANFAPPKNEPDGMTLMRRAYQVESGPFPVGKFTAEDWRKQRWGYYRMIEKVDAEIGKVLAALRQAGLEDNTLIIFTADHGECGGAHGFNQKTVLYDESARVPLIIACKGKTTGATTDKLVNTGVDLLPTMLDFAGLDVPKKLPGRSLLPLALGKPVAAWRDHFVVENNMNQAGEIDGLTPQMEGRMVRTDRYKYCLYSRGNRRESLVDLQADPGEMNDLAADPKFRDVLLAHRELLARFGKEHNDPLVAELLADNVKPMPFTADGSPKGRRDRAAAGL